MPLPFPLLASCWVAAISSVSIPASASIWWRRSSVPDGEVRRLVGEDALEAEHEAVAHLPRGRRRARPASISAIASSSARRRDVPGASACSGPRRREGTARQPTLRRGGRRPPSCPSPPSGGRLLVALVHVRSTSIVLQPREGRARESPGRARRPQYTPAPGDVNRPGYPRGVPEPPRPPNTANGLRRNRLPDQLSARLDLAVDALRRARRPPPARTSRRSRSRNGGRRRYPSCEPLGEVARLGPRRALTRTSHGA